MNLIMISDVIINMDNVFAIRVNEDHIIINSNGKTTLELSCEYEDAPEQFKKIVKELGFE